MEIIKRTVNDKTFTFVNEYKSTKNGFKHITTLFCENVELHTYKINYINRTWEMYTFQGVMKACIRDYQENIYNVYIEMYKTTRNIKRLSKKKKEELSNEIKTNNTMYNLLSELQATI